MQHLIETTGKFLLIDPFFRKEIAHDRPTVVKFTSFIQDRLANGQLNLLAGDIGDERTDEEFLAYWLENPEIAVEAFLSEFADTTELSEDAMALLNSALELMQADDFQKDGKPKVGALNKVLEDELKVDTKIRDQFWAQKD